MKTKIPVVITTEHRGVFFGYIDEKNIADKTIGVCGLRNCLYWPAEAKGFVGLAAVGPIEGSRVGPAADGVVQDITCVLRCTDSAAALWESAPWG